MNIQRAGILGVLLSLPLFSTAVERVSDWRVVGEMARATTAIQIEPVQLSADWRVVGGSEMTKGAV